jgi:hypothetical protein
MGVEAIDIGLPVEYVVEIENPVDQVGRAAGEQVVVAEKATLRVVGDIQIVTGVGRKNVVADFHASGAARDANIVALGSEKRIANDAHIVAADYSQAKRRVSVYQVVGNKLARLGVDSD